MTNVIAFLHTTAAYQGAAVQLMMAEANFVSKQLQLNDSIPATTNGLVEWRVLAPPMGIAGAIVTTNFTYTFERGRLAALTKRQWLQKSSATNLLDLSRQQNHLDTNRAFHLATQMLARLDLDLTALATTPLRKTQVHVRSADQPTGRQESLIPTPVFHFSWGSLRPSGSFRNPLTLKLLGTSSEAIELSIRDRTLWRRPRLELPNAAELLGPTPPARFFVEELFGGRTAYQTVSSPARIEAALLHSGLSDAIAGQSTIRRGPVVVSGKVAEAFSSALLDFDTYHWGAIKLCSPEYGLQLRFIRSTNTVQVRLCYECDIVEITSGGKTRTENFDFNHNELVNLAKQVFRRDAALEGLKQEDERALRREAAEMYEQLLTE